jgi:uncharacterized surface protein with fasciclin (FAS1) repeats
MKLAHRSLATVAALIMLPLAGCSDTGDKTNGDKPVATASASDTLAAALAGQVDLSQLNDALKETGLSQVFDNGASYTIFAPTDAAFDKMGDKSKALMQPGQKAVLAAILRDHIVPGYLTPDDIGTAIDAQGGQVKVKTMGGHKLSFTREGKGYSVTAEDGSSALIAGDPVTAADGVAIPVDGVLKKVEPAA